MIRGALILVVLIAAQAATAQLKCEDLIPRNSHSGRTSSSNFGAPTGTTDFFVKMSEGRQLFTQIVKPARKSEPTVLLLPGIQCNLFTHMPAVEALAASGLGVVSFNFSPHPLSIATLPQNVKPSFVNADYSLKDFANETEALIGQLEAQGIDHIVPISLSYSSAVSPSLQNSKLIIDVVPMTSMAAEAPQLETYRQGLLASQMLNPIFGGAIVRNMLDTLYREKAAQRVEDLKPFATLPENRSNDMVEGYVRLSRAVEGFAWQPSQMATGPRHIFILARNEEASLLKHQLLTFKTLLQVREDALMYLVLDATHLIFKDQPNAYSQTIAEIARGASPIQSGIIVVDPKKHSPRVIPRDEAFAYIDTLLSAL